MKTRILFIGLIILLVNVISVDAREVIKTCYYNKISGIWTSFVFPKDGGKPYGRYVEMLLSITRPLNLEIIFEEGKDIKTCLDKMRSGKTDIITYLYDKHDQIRDYSIMIPFIDCSDKKGWEKVCVGNKHVNFGISKKSKFASRVNEFKSVLKSQEKYLDSLLYAIFYRSDQHSWNGKDPNSVMICQNERVFTDGTVDFKWNSNEPYPFGRLVEIGNYYVYKLGKKPIYMLHGQSHLAVASGFCDISFAWEQSFINYDVKEDIKNQLELFRYDPSNGLYVIINKRKNILKDFEKIDHIIPGTEEGDNIFNTKWTSYDQHDWANKTITETKGGTIKTCFDNWVEEDGYNYWFFPEDGGKPYGSHVEILLSFTNTSKLKLEVEKDLISNCLNKLRNGEIDLMIGLADKDDRRDWLDFVSVMDHPFYHDSLIRIGISKKSEFASKKSIFSKYYGYPYDENQLKNIFSRKWSGSFDHSWYGYEKDEIEISYNCKKVGDEKKDDDSLDLTELADDSSDKETCEKRKLSEVTAYIDKEFIFSLYMNQMSEIVKLKKGLYVGSDDKSIEAGYYNVFGPVFFNINSPINSILLKGDKNQFIQYMTNISRNMDFYTRFSKKLANNIDYCLENSSACVFFDEAVVTYLVMKNSYNIDFLKSDSICNKGVKPVFAYSRDKKTGHWETKPYQRISFLGSCLERNPPHYFFGSQDSGSKTSPFINYELPYENLIFNLASYHLANTWNNKSVANTHLKKVKRLIKETKKILPNQKEWKGVTTFLTEYGKLMQNTIKTRKQVIEAAETAEKRQDEQKISDLKNKVRTPVNLEEAIIYFDGEYGGVPVFSTPYNPDGKVYGVHGTIKGMIGKYYRINMENIIVGKRDFLLNTSDTLSEGQYVEIVGTFNEVEMLSTLFSDVQKPYAVFSALKYLNGKLLK